MFLADRLKSVQKAGGGAAIYVSSFGLSYYNDVTFVFDLSNLAGLSVGDLAIISIVLDDPGSFPTEQDGWTRIYHHTEFSVTAGYYSKIVTDINEVFSLSVGEYGTGSAVISAYNGNNLDYDFTSSVTSSSSTLNISHSGYGANSISVAFSSVSYNGTTVNSFPSGYATKIIETLSRNEITCNDKENPDETENVTFGWTSSSGARVGMLFNIYST